MTPVIRIDDDVYAWLQGQARPFDDTPNSVLRRIAKLDLATATSASLEVRAINPHDERVPRSTTRSSTPPSPTEERLNANILARRWKVNARHQLYHKDGTWYNRLKKFPGALFDPNGYVIFKTEKEYLTCPQVSVGEQTNVRPHLSAIAGYVRMTNESAS